MTHDAQDWWDRAVERNRAALARIVAVLFVYAGLDEGGANTLPRHVWRRILRLLRPAESAVRRLIVIAARGVTVEAPKHRVEKAPTASEQMQAAGLLVIQKGMNFGLARAWSEQQAPVAPKAATPAISAFTLTDPPRRFDKLAWDGQRPFPRDGFELADPDEEVDAARLCRRLRTLKHALDDLPSHAMRLARREARRALAAKHHVPALRRGHPPGRRRKPTHRVDDIMLECHDLATQAVRLDTS